MTEEPTTHEDVTLDPWRVFQTRLEAYVSTMIDPRDEDRLVLRVPWAREVEPAEVLVSLRDEATTLWVDYPWDEAGFPADDPVGRADFAWRLCEAIRFRYSVPHPQLMSVHATGPASGGVGVLGLDTVGGSDLAAADPGVAWPESQDELRGLVLAHLRSAGHPTAEPDDDGDVPVLVDGVGLWVRAEPESPVLHLFTRVVEGVRSRRQTAVELDVLNRDHRWSRWVRRERDVWQELHVPASPFVADLLDTMLTGFAGDSRQLSGDLADRLGGRACS